MPLMIYPSVSLTSRFILKAFKLQVQNVQQFSDAAQRLHQALDSSIPKQPLLRAKTLKIALLTSRRSRVDLHVE